MAKIGVTDLLIQVEPDRDRLRIALSRAFGVDPGRVSITDIDGDRPIPDETQVLLYREPEDMPGDFPAWFSQAVDEGLAGQVDPAWDAVAAELGTVVLTEAPDYESTVHLPDGTRHVLYIPEEDEGGYLMTPKLRQLIDTAHRRLIAS
jgi:hypothetical protein